MSSKHFFKKSKKNTSVSKSKKKSPSIYRSIPDSAKASSGMPDFVMAIFKKFDRIKFFNVYKRVLKGFTVVFFLLVIIVLGYDLNINLEEKNRIDRERISVQREVKLWEEAILEHEDYRDAYFKLSALEYRLGNKEKARFYVKKGLVLDPNSSEGKKIEEFLNK